MSEFSGVLDLTSADTSGFAALETGTYEGELFEWKMAATKDKPDNKMPAGTPMLKVQFKITEELFLNRRLFDQFVIPPPDYDKDKRDKMLGALVRFFVAMGVEESEVKSKKFNMFATLNELVGSPVRIVAAKKQKYGTKPEDEEYDNEVKGYKSAETSAAGADRLL